MKKLSASGQASAQAENEFGETALMLTIHLNKKHCYGIAKELIEKGALVDIKSSDGTTALIDATVFYRYDICMELLNNGADINLANNEGSSPLIYASHFKFTRMVEKLIENGAKINHGRYKDNKSALYSALEPRENFPHLDQLNSKQISDEYNPSEVVNILLENKADVNQRLIDGRTPLFLNLSTINIEKLLKHGADVNLRNKEGLTAYDYTIKYDFYRYDPLAYELLKPSNDVLS